jgi:hypothetical protein
MLCGLPVTLRVLVEMLQAPPESVQLPMVVAPSLKVIVPLGVPPPELDVTVTVKVTD